MPIVIAGGPSVTDYPREDVINMASLGFTFAVNDVGLTFPCDVIVSIDPQMIVKRKEQLKARGKPIITRCWTFTQDKGKSMGLDIIPLTPREDCKRDEDYDRKIIERFPLSGMLACYLADKLAGAANGRKSYVLGMDASVGHFKGHPVANETTQYLDEARPLSKYEDMGLTNTINLSMRSKISCWPKYSKLPNFKKVLVSPQYRIVALAWLRANASKLFDYAEKK